MQVPEMIKELVLCEKCMQQRTKELTKVDRNMLKYDILMMEIEILGMLIANLRCLLEKHKRPEVSSQTRKAIYSIKPTIN